MKRIIAVLLALVLVFSFAACAKTKTTDPTTTAAPTDAAEDLVFKFVVVDLEGNKKDFDVTFTEGQTVADALLEQEQVAGEESEYGLYVKTVDGVTLDYDADGAYWSFYIGDEMATVGCDGEQAAAGATYQFVATKA